MADYRALVAKYKRRRRDTLVDAVTTGLTYADNVSMDLGLLEDAGVLGGALETVASALPFAVIAVSEQAKVVMGRKSQKDALHDTAFRALKTGAALGAGAALATAGAGLAVTLPAAVGVRVFLDQYKSKAMLGARVSQRTDRLRFLSQRWREHNDMMNCAAAPALLDGADKRLTE